MAESRKEGEKHLNPIKFKEQNTIFAKPESMTDEQCNSLPTYRDNTEIISCWKMGIKERIRVLFTGIVWLSIYGNDMPPVWLGTETLFKKEGLTDGRD